MAHCRADIEVPRGIDEAFAYLAHFERVAEWDPSVVSARKLDPGPVAPGTRFHVVTRFLGRDVELTYTAVQVDAPARLVLEAHAPGFRSLDVVTFETTAAGTRIHYDANLTLAGVLYVFDLPLHLAFQWIGRRAIAGLRRALA